MFKFAVTHPRQAGAEGSHPANPASAPEAAPKAKAKAKVKAAGKAKATAAGTAKTEKAKAKAEPKPKSESKAKGKAKAKAASKETVTAENHNTSVEAESSGSAGPGPDAKDTTGGTAGKKSVPALKRPASAKETAPKKFIRVPPKRIGGRGYPHLTFCSNVCIMHFMLAIFFNKNPIFPGAGEKVYRPNPYKNNGSCGIKVGGREVLRVPRQYIGFA